MTAISATEARSNFSEYLGRVAYGKERVTIERRGRPLAVLLPLEDLARLEAGDGDPAGAATILSAVADNIPGTVYQRIRQPDGREENSYVSPGIRDVFGIEPDAAISDPQAINRAIHPEDRALRARAIAESARALSTYDVQYRVLTPAGETKWLHTIARPERRADGAVIWSGLTLDITKWKATEAALRETEARLAAILDHAPVEIYLKDKEGRFIEVNRHYEDLWGMTGEQVQGKLPAEVHDDAAFAEASRAHDLAVLETGQTLEREDDVELGDGRHSLHMIKFPIRDDAGRITGLGAIASDVTERNKAEAALRQSEARLRDLIDGSIEGILIHQDHKPVMVNEAWAAIHGYTVDEILGIDSVVDLIVPTERARLIGYRDARLHGEAAPDRYEYRALRKDGTKIWLEQLARLVDWGGAPAVQTVVIDITERKAAEAALERARDELEQRVEERTRELHATNRALEEEAATRMAVEERLRESERDLLNLIEGSVLGVLIITEDRRPRFANRAYAEIFGYQSPEEILALETTLPLIAPYEIARLDELREPHFGQADQPIGYEFDGIRKDGTTIRLQCMARAMTWRGERVAQITLHDITERERAERALRESRGLLQAVVDAVPAMVNAKDLESRYIFMNRFQAELYGVQPEQVVGQTADQLVDSEHGAYTRKLDQKVIDSRAALPYFEETLEIDRSPSRNWLTTKVPLLDEKNRVKNIVTVSLDITERKMAEEELARSEERLRQATELAGLGHCIWDSIADRCLFCSEEYARIHGVTPEAYIARATTVDCAFNHPDDQDAYRAAVTALRRGEPFEMEYRVIAPDGAIKHVREIAKPIFDETGAVTREICTIQDITERKKAEEMVRTRDSWLRAILENAPLQIVLKDTEGQIMAISRVTGEMLGTGMDEFPGRTTADFLPKDVAEIYMATDREVLRTGRAIQQEVVEDWDGTTRHFLNSKFPLRDDAGHIIGVCSLTDEITEVKRAEERLRQAQKMEAVGQLTGGVAHDFNNLLAVVVGNAELLAEQLGADNRQVAAVLRAAGRGAELTQRLLAFSRRQPLKPQAIDLTAQIAGLTELLSRTLGATIEISVASAPGLWRASADPGQLENALLNLAINARDAMAEGGRLSITSSNASLQAEEIAALLAGQAPEAALEAATGGSGDYVVLSVSDTGSGMSPSVLAHVFEPFFTTKDVGQGSGLGLSMVYGFARQSGGFVAIESTEGRGTTVRLYLPRAEAVAPSSEDREGADRLPRGHGQTVLLLEDTRDVRELAIALLENLGYRVLAAAEASEAAALLTENPRVDLLLTDVILPGRRSGRDFAEIARRHNPALKVLFMSGYPAETLMPHAGSLDRDTPLLSKPFRKAALAKAVRDALEDRQ